MPKNATSEMLSGLAIGITSNRTTVTISGTGVTNNGAGITFSDQDISNGYKDVTVSIQTVDNGNGTRYFELSLSGSAYDLPSAIRFTRNNNYYYLN